MIIGCKRFFTSKIGIDLHSDDDFIPVWRAEKQCLNAVFIAYQHQHLRELEMSFFDLLLQVLQNPLEKGGLDM